jgi:hypothetical protein
MLLMVADVYEHARLAAVKYQISSWSYVPTSQELKGIMDAIVVMAGPCKNLSHEMYYILRKMEQAGRIITMRLPT